MSESIGAVDGEGVGDPIKALVCPRCGDKPEQFQERDAYRCERCNKNSRWLSIKDWNRRFAPPDPVSLDAPKELEEVKRHAEIRARGLMAQRDELLERVRALEKTKDAIIREDLAINQVVFEALEAIIRADNSREIADHVIFRHKNMTAKEVCEIVRSAYRTGIRTQPAPSDAPKEKLIGICDRCSGEVYEGARTKNPHHFCVTPTIKARSKGVPVYKMDATDGFKLPDTQPAPVEEGKPGTIFEIVGTDGKVHYRRPMGHPDLRLSELRQGYSIRLMEAPHPTSTEKVEGK